MRLPRLVAAAALAAAVVPARAPAGPLTQDACPGAATAPVVWKQMGNDVLENLLFADDSMWVSDGTRSAVVRLGPDGTEQGAVTGIPSPGGLAQGADGLIYAGWGNSLANATSRNGQAKVVRIDPASSVVDVYSEGFHMANGMAFGPDGALYVSNDVDTGLLRILPGIDDPRANWALVVPVWGTNGLVIDGGTMYAAITFDQRSPIARISLSEPVRVDHDIQLTFGAASLQPAVHTDGDPDRPLLGVKGLDDMTRGPDGMLYVVANGTGELLRVDPATGDACLVAVGMQNPSSVRVAPHGSAFADATEASLDLYVTEFSGAIRLVRYTP